MLEWNLLTILAIVSACISLYVLSQSMFQGPAKGLDQRMQEFAKQAVELAQSEYHARLDYSLESIAIVDQILEKLHRNHLDTAIPERELSRIVLTWGGYLGTVLKKQRGGHWEADSPTSGNHTYPLFCQKREAVPVMWCLQRIRRGDSARVDTKTKEFLATIDGDSV